MKIKMDDKELIIKYKSKKVYKDIYDKICENTMGINLNEIHIKYKIKKEDNKIRIFGNKFIHMNYNNCKILWNYKIYNLISHLDLKHTKTKFVSEIKIKLKGIKRIKIAKEMFSNCSSLKSLPDISKWNTNNVTDMMGLFLGCSSLKSLPDISKWNINNVTNMMFLFVECSSLKSLPDISKWNTNNVINMSGIFLNVHH